MTEIFYLSTRNIPQHLKTETSAVYLKHPKKSKIWLFRLVLILLPFLFIGVLEFGLRIFGYGHDTSLFVPYGNTGKLVMNRYASEKYFGDTVNATQGLIEPFSAQKTEGVKRIFVLGESTTIGYPYHENGSFHRWLLYRLIRSYPQQNFEMINVSLTAVNSYTVLDFGKEVASYSPDAILVYTGHNEYYGAMGVGSTSRIGSNRFLVRSIIKLRQLRLAQLLGNLFSGLKNQTKGTDENRETLMQKMAAKQRIKLDSKDFKAGISQFRQNMDELCRFYADKNILVFISTLVSNEKDLHPFISNPKDKPSAEEEFKIGQDAMSTHHPDEAKTHFIKAKEMDLLRFRAPEAMNGTIKNLGKTYSNVFVVDARERFEAFSPDKILGHETLLEHVHPNLTGYALLSDAFFTALKTKGLIKTAKEELPFDSLLREMPVTKMDSLQGAYEVMMLKTAWPFNVPLPKDFKVGSSIDEVLASDIALKKTDWVSAMRTLLEEHIKTENQPGILKAAGGLALQFPFETGYYAYAGNAAYKLGKPGLAIFYIQKAYDLQPDFTNARNLFILLLKLDEPEKALPAIETAINADPNQQKFTQMVKATTEKIISLKSALKQKPGDAKLRKQVEDLYRKMGNADAAKKYAN